MEVTIVIIEDRVDYKEHAIVYELKDKYSNVEFYTTPYEGLDFIEKSLSQNLIVLLDIQFPKDPKDGSHKDGHNILEEITKMSKLIPVILWSGINENEESFSDFINNHAFGFISKDATNAEAMAMVEKAHSYLKTSLSNTLEDWLLKNSEDKDKPIYITSKGSVFTLNDIIREIRMQTETGREFAEKLNNLTIDLLLRNKESLND